MSAGGLSYSALQTNRRVTLPSVEMWGTNMNIIEDPNQGIYTRKIDKVGDTQGVLLSQETSGDRIAEMIQVYARGVNPMVSVSYDNAGNNAGARRSILQQNQSVKLPYRPEVFRPPIVRQEQLMPLSRQPREWFYALTNPMFPHILEETRCSNDVRSAISDRNPSLETVSNLQYYETNLESNSGLPSHSVHSDILQGSEKDRTTQPLLNHLNNTHFHDSTLSKGIVENKLIYSALTNTSSDHYRDTERSLHQQKAIYDSILHPECYSSPTFLPSSSRIDGSLPTSEIHSNILHPESNTSAVLPYPKTHRFTETPKKGILSEDQTLQGSIPSALSMDKKISLFTSHLEGGEITPPLATECYSNLSHLRSQVIPSSSSHSIRDSIPLLETTVTPSFTHYWKSPVESNSFSLREDGSSPFLAIREPLTVHNTTTTPVFTEWKSIRDDSIMTTHGKTKESMLQISCENQPTMSKENTCTFSHSIIENLHRPLRSEIRGHNIETSKEFPIKQSSNSIYSTENVQNSGKLKAKELIPHISLITNYKKEERNALSEKTSALPRRTLLIDNTESISNPSMDTIHSDPYTIQSREATHQVYADTSCKGSFEQTGSFIPQFSHYISDTYTTDMPINDRFMEVKRKAVHTFMDRYHTPS